MVGADGEVAAKYITTEVLDVPNYGENFQFVNAVMRLRRVQEAQRKGDGDPRAVMALFQSGSARNLWPRLSKAVIPNGLIS